jgi:hypothetical protein
VHAHLACSLKVTPGVGRSVRRVAPGSALWIDMRRLVALGSTAQMMFFGPKAASPPKNTPARVDWKVFSSTSGCSHWLNSMPMSRSIHGKAFSWPIARITVVGRAPSSSPIDALGGDAAVARRNRIP